jgi:hypothetical protein
MTTHYLTLPFFTRKFLSRYNMTIASHPPYFSLFSGLKMKLKDLHFDTTKVIETVSQAVLNTLTEHDFRISLKMAEPWNSAYALERTISRVVVASRLKFSFDHMAVPVPEIMDCSLYSHAFTA